MAQGQLGAELLERGDELATLTGLLEAARLGSGCLAVIEGPAGIGKSSLLNACAGRAEGQGMVVLRVAGDELVMGSSFAAVRELLWAEVHDDARGRFQGAARLAAPVFEADPGVSADRDRASAVMHGLYWLVADLGSRAPMALIVDDAQWLDPASARFLVYLARRIESLPALLAVAIRTGEGADTLHLGAELADLVGSALKLAPLSIDASRQVIRARLGARADEELCDSCHRATRGNPFYLRELAAALYAEGGHPTVELARRVRALGVTAISTSVLLRLARLGGECERCAHALSVLGPGASLRRVATLASLDRDQAMSAVDRLYAADLLSAGPALSFVHPIVNDAISSQLPPARRAALHADAARILAAEGAPADRIAAHLLSSEPYGKGWVVDVLRLAARGALARGAPEAAVSYLRRALDEPPAQEARLEVLVELGRAEALLPMAHDFTSLREALSLTADPRRRAEMAFELALALFGVLRNVEAIAILDDALESEADLDPETVERLDQTLIGGGIGDLQASPRLFARAERYFERARRGDTQDARMLATLAGAASIGRNPVDEAVKLARAALSDERLLHDWLDDGYVCAAGTLCWTDQLAEATTALDAGIMEAERRGSAPMLLQLTLLCTETAIRAGNVNLAEEYAQRAGELGRELGAEHLAVLWLPLVLLERGRLEDAAELMEAVELSNDRDTWEMQLVAHRGRIRIARSESEAGLADLLEIDRRMAAAELRLSAVTDWVPAAALALVTLGRAEEARELAARELADAAALGSARRHGIALSVCGTLDSGPQGLSWLGESVSLLETSPARLEHARALVNLGIGLLERGEREAARKPLALGQDLAHRCGAFALVDRAYSALLSSGARPRRAALTGPGALTAAERRTARMAAQGLGNREIAQALFLSTKTVESQLSCAYDKLGIRSRGQLSGALKLATPAAH